MRPELKLLTCDEIKRRILRMTGPKNVKRPTEITRHDLAKWFGVDERWPRQHMAGVRDINDFWQVAYSQFFAMLDAGLIEIRHDELGRKTLVRVAKPTAPVKKTLRPWINLDTMTLALDR